jgi:hypothetical protein
MRERLAGERDRVRVDLEVEGVDLERAAWVLCAAQHRLTDASWLGRVIDQVHLHLQANTRRGIPDIRPGQERAQSFEILAQSLGEL